MEKKAWWSLSRREKWGGLLGLFWGLTSWIVYKVTHYWDAS